MSAELVVVWNGAHHGADADLLCVQPILTKTAGTIALPPEETGKPRRAGYHDERCRRLVALLSSGKWFSVRAMVMATASTEDEIYVVIQRLHRQERMEKRVVPRADRRRGEGWMEYRLRAGQGHAQ